MKEFIPMNDRMTMSREKKVLTLWQERQKDWQQVEHNITKRIKAKDSHTLMMLASDEYRARIEEYDLLLAAIPEKDRIGAQWELSLRGGGPRKVAIGHLFSGIECEVDSVPPVPKVVRKPRLPEDKPHKDGPMIDETEAILNRRKKLAKNLEQIRPHNLSYKEAENLIFKSTSLVEWAINTSEQHFETKRAEVPVESTEEVEGEEMVSNQVSQATPAEHHDEGVPTLSVLNIPEATFVARKEQISTRTFGFTNSSDTTMYYQWKPLHPTRIVPPSTDLVPQPNETPQQAMFNSLGREVKFREHLLSYERTSFFCPQDRGVLLPGETVQSSFSFYTKGWAGAVTEEWVLETTPKAQVVFPDAYNAMYPDDEDEDETAKRKQAPVHFTFRGHSTEEDETTGLRDKVSSELDAATLESLARDQIQLAFERVRAPVTKAILQERQ